MKKLSLLILVTAAVIVLPQSASAQVCFHGIAVLKSTEPFTPIGDPYVSSYLIVNTAMTQAQDTVEISGLSDTVFASGGNVVSGNILHTLDTVGTGWTLLGGAFWKDPGHTIIVMPFGSSAQSPPYSFYNVVSGDYFLPDHKLQDQVTVNWKSICNTSSCPDNCSEIGQTATASGATTIQAPLPCIDVTKTVDCPIATVGKMLTYTITVTNCGPNPLTKVSINDSLLGTLSGCDSLAVGANCTITANYTVQAGDPDPLVNTVDVNYVDAFGQHATDTASASVDIIHPNYTITKTCLTNPIDGPDALFDVTITNTGDVPLSITTNEAALSDTPEPFTVPVGGSESITITKPSTCPTDVSNSITASATVDGLVCPITPIVKTAPAEGSVTCFCSRCVNVTKTPSCPVGTLGQVITYTYTIENCSGVPLTLVSVIDNKLGNLTVTAQSNGCTTLAAGASCTFTVDHTLAAGDEDPLVNMVTVDYVDAQDMHVTDSATATVDIIHPNFTATKTCTSEPIPAGGPATFEVVITNTGDVSLSFTTNEADKSSVPEPFELIAGASRTLTITIPATGTVDVPNTIQVTATLVDQPACAQFNTGNIKTAGDTCHGAGAATRTWGFWKTHTDFTKCVFDKCGSSFDLGWRVVDSYAELFGIFEADNAKNSNGTIRCSLGKARVTASKQALAALLNTCLENGKPLPAGVTPCTIKNTLLCGTVAQIMALNSKLDAYNNSGDNVSFTIGECPKGNATPAASKAAANKAFADTIGSADCEPSSSCAPCP